ncbi:uncharacterized protein LOC120158778 [Hibiscus syriacus]|uniref:uncharacterized protein LOC120158778 n=1 Tax=Hibiscus syriacus TaxID=106335 RepID=UPI0019248453|nr:uncharacterized protein LOC120158778 [Hibiscus syriacus]
MNQKQHVEVFIMKQSNQAKQEYKTHLTATIDCVQFLLRKGLALRRHDEFDDSRNQGNFIELLQFLEYHNEIVNKVLQNTRDNLNLVASNIQKYIVSVAASETTCAIIDELMLSEVCLQLMDYVFPRIGGRGYDGTTFLVVAEKQVEVAFLFNMVASVVNVVSASCKRKEILQSSQVIKKWLRKMEHTQSKESKLVCY